METYQRYHHDPEQNELNEAYYEYLLLGHRNKLGSLNDLVCRYEGEEQDPSAHWTRFLEECAE